MEDCYHPERTPSDEILRMEHARFAKMLAATEVDLILVETQNSQREAVIATQAALATGLPVWTSLMPKSSTEMFNGDDLAETARLVQQLGVEVVLINCARPAVAAGAFGVIAEVLKGQKVGVYPNLLQIENPKFQIQNPKSKSEERKHEILHPLEDSGVQDDKFIGIAAEPEGFAEWMSGFAVRAAVLGGCCGTTPEHIAALCRKLNSQKER